MKMQIAKNKKLTIASDFDDTLTNKYIYDSQNNSHKPILDKALVKLISKINSLGIPFLIATSRGMDDPNLDIISKISGFPMIIESGGALYQKGTVEKLISNSQFEDLNQTKVTINPHTARLKEIIKLKGFVLLIRFDRVCSIEFRIQDKNGKGINVKENELYFLLEKELKIIIKRKILKLSIKKGGSSLNIVPQGVSKEIALRRLFEKINLNRGATFVVGIGDSEQDQEIFKFSDFSVCVGDLKVTGSSEHIPGGSKSVIEFLNNLVNKYEQSNL